MNEFFLHHVWKLKLFSSRDLTTADGEPIEILKTGLHNNDAGPDFFNAQIKIGKTLWAGNVEIHLKSSDWKNHAHEKDKAYDNVILHVVFEDDQPVMKKNGLLIPTLELKGKFDFRLWENYKELQNSNQWIPCQDRVSNVDAFIFNNWLDRLAAERLEKKSAAILVSMEQNRGNWEETFYQHLAKNFGFRINALPFEMLARSLPMLHLTRHKDHLHQLEAMLFGVGGMLENEMKDEYPRSLQIEFAFLKIKFSLKPISVPWKFLRLRPVNFPTIRIAQFAKLVHRSTHLFSKILECTSLKELEKYFEAGVSDYWQTHFVFDKPSVDRAKNIGKEAFNDIMINTLVPFLFVYGTSRGSDIHRLRALQFLMEIPAENNVIIRNWKHVGVRSGSAYHSQALLQLKNEYCSEKKCLLCSIGNELISHLE